MSRSAGVAQWREWAAEGVGTPRGLPAGKEEDCHSTNSEEDKPIINRMRQTKVKFKKKTLENLKIHLPWLTTLCPVWLQNRLISAGLEPILSHTEKIMYSIVLQKFLYKKAKVVLIIFLFLYPLKAVNNVML